MVININKNGEVVGVAGRRLTPDEAQTLYDLITGINAKGIESNGGDYVSNDQSGAVAQDAHELHRRQ